MMKLIPKLFRKRSTLSVPVRLATSVSDNQAYPEVCLKASHDYNAFNNFRRNPIYNQILEHVSEQLGQQYFEEIFQDAEIMGAMDQFKSNDDYGNPRQYEYSAIGKMSPSTLRYIKVLCDLKTHFQTLDHLSLCEIGVGYGGQCRVVNAYYRPASYGLVDIKPALSLAQRYLDHYIIPSTLSYRTMNELEKKDYDLVISNYAFTELPRSIQDVYLRKIILCSKRGYITYNEMTPEGFNSCKADELVEMIPNSRIVEERPLTHPKNCIIVWGVDV